MRALTFHRPWIGGAILAPDDRRPKRLENRWTKPPICIMGERFALHSGKVYDSEAAEFIAKQLGYGGDVKPDYRLWDIEGIVATAVCAGWIVRPLGGVFDVYTVATGQLTFKASLGDQERWWRNVPGNVAWILEDVRPLVMPVRCRGKQGPWIVPPDIAEVIDIQQTGA